MTLEVLTGIRRAGADLILTYHAKEAADWLGGSGGELAMGSNRMGEPAGVPPDGRQ